MANKKWYVIGLMSGTSLDGLDLVYVKIELDKGYHFEILETDAMAGPCRHHAINYTCSLFWMAIREDHSKYWSTSHEGGEKRGEKIRFYCLSWSHYFS